MHDFAASCVSYFCSSPCACRPQRKSMRRVARGLRPRPRAFAPRPCTQRARSVGPLALLRRQRQRRQRCQDDDASDDDAEDDDARDGGDARARRAHSFGSHLQRRRPRSRNGGHAISIGVALLEVKPLWRRAQHGGHVPKVLGVALALEQKSRPSEVPPACTPG